MNKIAIIWTIWVLLPFPQVLWAKEVSIAVEGKTLAGVLNDPGGDRSTAVFILAGSGATDRDGNTIGAFGKNNSLLLLSDALNEKGFATLRVDKRGVGASANGGIDESKLRFNTYVSDAQSWIKFLGEQGFSEVVLLGHSEGALVATLAASTTPVTGLICVAGAGRSAPEILLEQLEPKLPKPLFDQADKAIASLAAGETVDDYPTSLQALFRPSVQPYLISWFRIDPVRAISEVQVPILVVQGSTDLQISTKDAELLHAGAEGSQLFLVEGMNHVLKEAHGDLSTQMPSYFNPDLPLHSELANGLVEFLETIAAADHESLSSPK